MNQRPILLVSNCAWNLANFRLPVIEALIAAGHRVICAGAADGYVERLRQLGVAFAEVKVDAGGTSPAADLRLLKQLVSLVRKERPALMLTFTIKPNIYGLLAARACRVPAVPTVSGLGSSFLGGGIVGTITASLYRLAFGRTERVIFQNADDRDLFVGRGLVSRTASRLVPGSGIDLDRYRVCEQPSDEPFRFLLVARLLKDKGLAEYAEAARQLRREGSTARFQLLGPAGKDNPSAVPMSDVERWVADGTIDYLGSADDVRGPISGAHCLVLPSYREGLPRSLLEGAAMGRALIATDVPGCREVVRDGENGYLCAPRSPEDLARAMRQMLALDRNRRVAMGRYGRRMVEEAFDQRIVAAAYLDEVGR